METPKPKLLCLLIGLAVLTIVATAGFLLGKNSTGPKTLQIPLIGPTPTQACGPCPQFMPPSPDSCQHGTIIPGILNECGCQMPPTCDKTTTGWKTYSDPSILKISFKYPADWTADKVQTYASKSEISFFYQKNPLFSASIVANYNNGTGKPYASLDEFLGKRKTNSKETSVNNYPAKRVSDPGSPGHVVPFEEIVLFSLDNSSIVWFYYSPGYYDVPNPISVFDKILSTFKFLE